MCRGWWIQINQILSIIKELLLSIPQTDRQQEDPDKKLLETILNNERALGVLWNIEDDKLGFEVHMKEKPLTRCGMLS